MDNTLPLHCAIVLHNSDLSGDDRIKHHNIVLPSDQTITDILETVSNITEQSLLAATGTLHVDLRTILVNYLVW